MRDRIDTVSYWLTPAFFPFLAGEQLVRAARTYNLPYDSFVVFIIAGFITVQAVHVSRKRNLPKVMLICWTSSFFLTLTLLFARVYWDIGTAANFGVDLSKIDSIYFALGTLTTAGTGTIAPTSGLARGITSGQMIVDFVFIAAAVTIAISRWSEHQAQ